MRLFFAFLLLAGGIAAALGLAPRSERLPPTTATFRSEGLFDYLERRSEQQRNRHEGNDEARRRLLEGYAESTEWLRSDASEAAVHRAARALREGDPARARRDAVRIRFLASDAETVVHAEFVHAVAAAQDERCEEATEAWQATQQRPARSIQRWAPALPWVQRRMAACYRQLGRASVAVALADQALEPLDGSTEWHHARLEATRARLADPEHRAEGIRRAHVLLRVYPELPLDHVLRLELADALLHTGQLSEARRIIDTWLFEWPDHALAPTAHELSARLHERGAGSTPRSWRDLLEAGKRLRWERRWDAAEAFLLEAEERASMGGVGGAVLDEIRFERAGNAWESARFEDCLTLLDRVESSESNPVEPREMVRWRVRCLSRVGRVDDAWDIAHGFYGQRSRTEANRVLLEYAMDFGRWDDARRIRRSMGASERDFEAGFLAYMARDLTEAIRVFEGLSSSGTTVERSRARYWLGRARHRAGRVDSAVSAWQQNVDASPASFYGLQSANRILEIDEARRVGEDAPLRRPGRIHWDGIHGPSWGRLQEMERSQPHVDFFDTWQEARPVDGSVERFATRWGHIFPEAIAAHALFDVGLGEDARRALREVALEFRSLDALFDRGRESSEQRPIRLERRRWTHEIDNRGAPRGYWGIELGTHRWPVPTQPHALRRYVERHRTLRDARAEVRGDLMEALAEVGDAWTVRRAVFASSSVHSLPMDGEGRLQWLRAYPLAYGRLIEPHARAYDQNPLLLVSLMILESDMNPDSISRADAYGLLQVIPRTGQRIALARNDPEFGIHSLLDPASSISYGMWYLHELLRKFDGQEILAMVAYNAGPHQVQRWLDWRGEGMDLDEFLETVPFNGARTYPMRVLQYLSTYRALHAGTRSIYIGNALERRTLNNIYF